MPPGEIVPGMECRFPNRSGKQLCIRENVQRHAGNWFKVSILVLVLAAGAAATPIQPDIEKLLSKPHSEHQWFEPARAGWEGPEAEASGPSRTSLVLEEFGPAETARLARASFLAAAVPDPRVWACLCALIFILRKRKRATPELVKASDSDTAEVKRAA